VTLDGSSGNSAAQLSAAMIRMDRALEALSLNADEIPDAVWSKVQIAWGELTEASNDIIRAAMVKS
jgi:hypothetical protein